MSFENNIECRKTERIEGRYRRHTENNSYVGMKDRCYNSRSPRYKDYGGRGIIVCDRWLGKDGYKNFLEDMGRKPSPELTLERINNDGNYEPGNCKWATKKEQAQNTRRTKEARVNKMWLPKPKRKKSSSSWVPTIVVCSECGAQLTQKRPWHHFCNPTCRMRFYQKTQRKMLVSALSRIQELETGKAVAPPKRDLFS